MTERLVERAAKGDEAAFRELTDPHRRELQVHCYRILGSMQDAEDIVQETLLAAWRAMGGLERHASLRAWLYRIATNRCLNALRAAGRRPPVAAELSHAPAAPTRFSEPTWIEPYPDSLLEGLPDLAPGPDARLETSEAVGLAFIAALQCLPPRQRAVLVLRDVLGFRATEVATMLDSSEDSVKAALKRARATLEERRAAVDRDSAPAPNSPAERRLVSRFATAWEAADIDGIIGLLTESARVTMPPATLEYDGLAAIGSFLWQSSDWREHHKRHRLVPTRANTQPAFGLYRFDEHAPIAHAAGLLVLTLDGERISVIRNFLDSGVLSRFGLPRTLEL